MWLVGSFPLYSHGYIDGLSGVLPTEWPVQTDAIEVTDTLR